MTHPKRRIKKDKSENSSFGCGGCLLILLMIFLVGFGSCVGIIFVDDALQKQRREMQEEKEREQRKKEKEQMKEQVRPFFQEIKARVDNNQATATDLYLFAHMFSSEEFRKDLGITELSNEYLSLDDIYVDYLRKAIDKGSQEAKLDYACFLFSDSRYILERKVKVNTKEKHFSLLKLKYSIVLMDEVFNTQCEVYKSPRYPKFHAYPEEIISVKDHNHIVDWFDDEEIKSDYPEFYQLAEKAKESYKKNCEKDKP